MLADAGDLEDGALDLLGQLLHGRTRGQAAQRVGHHARPGDAHRDGRVTLAEAVEGTGHEGVVGHGVGEDHELGAADGGLVGGRARRSP